jgi:hypothetical protein
MNVVLPAPAEVRAIVVGIERYPGLGQSFDAPGAAAGALAFARWLVTKRQVPVSGIDLWLSLRDESDVHEACKAAGLAGATVHEFDGPMFRLAMAEPRDALADGTFLMVYFCGHGVVSGARGEQHLVLPEATEKQFQCFETGNWRELFRGSGWERFGHQLWIVDACRNQWGDAMRPVRNEWNPGEPHLVRQCAMFACAPGGAAAIDSKDGPRFTRELLATLAGAPAAGVGWPAFDEALRETAARLRADPAAGQSPTLSIGEDWFGFPMVGPGLAGKTLYALLSTISWPYERFKPYVMRARAAASVGVVPPADLERAIEQLHEAAPVDGVPPLLDFAERVARAAPSPALQAWVKARLAPQQLAELDARLAADVGRARLSLWYRDDGAQPCIEGELDVLDASGGVRTWPRAEAKPVTTENVGATIGQWMQAVYTHVGGVAIDLVVELYLPRALLTAAAYDTAIVPIDAGDELRLGEDHPALLRCTDRYKGPTKLSRWRKHAPKILARLAQAPAERLRWAAAGESADGLRSAFVVEAAAAPVWLGFEPAVCGSEAPLDVALTEGLPAVVWLRAGSGGESIDALRAGLQDLLKSPLDELPGRLVDWRSNQANGAGKSLSLLLDDPARLPAMWASWTQPGG